MSSNSGKTLGWQRAYVEEQRNGLHIRNVNGRRALPATARFTRIVTRRDKQGPALPDQAFPSRA